MVKIIILVTGRRGATTVDIKLAILLFPHSSSSNMSAN